MRDLILDELGYEKQKKWEKKQEKWEEYKKSQDALRNVYNALKQARDEMNEAREILNHEYEFLKEEHPGRSAIWNEYEEKRRAINAIIRPLKNEANREHRLMVECFEAAGVAYKEGDREKTKELSQEGREHKARRNELNNEFKEGVDRIKTLKAEAMEKAPPHDRSAFDLARDRFYASKRTLANLQTKFNRMKEEKEQKYEEFTRADHEFAEARKTFEARLEIVRRMKEKEDELRAAYLGDSWPK